MPTLVAVLDADVLVPILSCDLLLSAFDEDLYRPVITATVLGEIERNQVHDFANLDPVALRGRVAQVAAALSHHTHDEGDVSAAAVATVNRKDRHVAATALAHLADVVVSNDRRLRREINALGEPLRVRRHPSPAGLSPVRRYCHRSIAPKRHRTEVVDDFSVDEYLELQRRVYRIGAASGAKHDVVDVVRGQRWPPTVGVASRGPRCPMPTSRRAVVGAVWALIASHVGAGVQRCWRTAVLAYELMKRQPAREWRMTKIGRVGRRRRSGVSTAHC